jgi:hypothetical protein
VISFGDFSLDKFVSFDWNLPLSRTDEHPAQKKLTFSTKKFTVFSAIFTKNAKWCCASLTAVCICSSSPR